MNLKKYFFFVTVSFFILFVNNVYSQTFEPILTDTPTPSPIISPTPSPTPKIIKPLKLVYVLPKFIEGKKNYLTLKIDNKNKLSSDINISGRILYDQGNYSNDSPNLKEIFFEFNINEEIKIEIIFKRAGNKLIQIIPNETIFKPINIKTFVNPFKTTVFPVKLPENIKLSNNPLDWYVWVNLYYSYMRQPAYYQVTYKDEIIQRFLTSPAKVGFMTPTGTYNLGLKLKRPKSEKYNAYMPFWTTINIPPVGSFGNHGLEGEGYLYLLGAPASHGCIRLSFKYLPYYNPKTKRFKYIEIGAAKWVYDNVPIGTKITLFRLPNKYIEFEIYGNLNRTIRNF